jgi:hypothetical protein
VTSGSTTSAAGNGELTEQATEGLVAILSAAGGVITKAAIAGQAFKHFAKDPNRNALVQVIYSDEFLKQDGAPWSFDGTTVTLG